MSKNESTILFATEFSDAARQAYPFAAALTKALDARLVLLNVLQLPMEMDPQYPVNEIYLKQLGSDRHAYPRAARHQPVGPGKRGRERRQASHLPGIDCEEPEVPSGPYGKGRASGKRPVQMS